MNKMFNYIFFFIFVSHVYFHNTFTLETITVSGSYDGSEFENDFKQLSDVLKKYAPNATDQHGNSILILAAYFGKVSIVTDIVRIVKMCKEIELQVDFPKICPSYKNKHGMNAYGIAKDRLQGATDKDLIINLEAICAALRPYEEQKLLNGCMCNIL